LLAALAVRPAAVAMMASSARADEAEPSLGKILMPLGDATETLDRFYPFFRIAEAGFQAA
jgi:hypothetical protein